MIISYHYIQTVEVVILLGYGVLFPIIFLFRDAPFSLGFCECVREKHNRHFLSIMLLGQKGSASIVWSICVHYILIQGVQVV